MSNTPQPPPLVPGSLAMRKAALATALDSAVNVIAETREFIRREKDLLTPGDRQQLAVTLEGMGRVCFSVAGECERQAKPANKEGVAP